MNVLPYLIVLALLFLAVVLLVAAVRLFLRIADWVEGKVRPRFPALAEPAAMVAFFTCALVPLAMVVTYAVLHCPV